jgi:hypothetical protein
MLIIPSHKVTGQQCDKGSMLIFSMAEKLGKSWKKKTELKPTHVINSAPAQNRKKLAIVVRKCLSVNHFSVLY